MSNYTYTKNPVDLDRLTKEIRESVITVALDHADYSSGTLVIFFKDDLNSTNKDALDSLVAAHSGDPLPGDVATEVIPRTPKNEHDLKPFGMVKCEFIASDHCGTITLSNKLDNTYTWAGNITPVAGSFLGNANWVNRVRVGLVSGNQLTLDGEVSNGEYKISVPFNLDYELPMPSKGDYHFLWGLFFDAINYGDDDFAISQVCDTYNALGLGTMAILKEYDASWVRHIVLENIIKTPDGAPGQLNPTLTIRVQYFCTKSNSDTIKVWLDHILTEMD